MSIDAYKAVFESSITFGVRKLNQAGHSGGDQGRLGGADHAARDGDRRAQGGGERPDRAVRLARAPRGAAQQDV
eukprot:scaffold94992_cov75-Phaeocystis_antarctica.AAC.1